MKYFNNFEKNMLNILNSQDYTVAQKNIIHTSYITTVTKFRHKLAYIGFMHTTLIGVISIGNILVVALLSIDKLSLQANTLFWFVWAIALLTAIANAFVNIMDYANKFIILEATLEKMISEGWKFFSQIEKYDIEDNTLRYKLFIKKINDVKLNYARLGIGSEDVNRQAERIMDTGAFSIQTV